MSKPFDAIDSYCVAQLGYEYNGRQWIEKAYAPAVIDVDTDEEAEMDIPPSSLTGDLSPHTLPNVGVGSSSAPRDWYQN